MSDSMKTALKRGAIALLLIGVGIAVGIWVVPHRPPDFGADAPNSFAVRLNDIEGHRVYEENKRWPPGTLVKPIATTSRVRWELRATPDMAFEPESLKSLRENVRSSSADLRFRDRLELSGGPSVSLPGLTSDVASGKLKAKGVEHVDTTVKGWGKQEVPSALFGTLKMTALGEREMNDPDVYLITTTWGADELVYEFKNQKSLELDAGVALEDVDVSLNGQAAETSEGTMVFRDPIFAFRDLLYPVRGLDSQETADQVVAALSGAGVETATDGTVVYATVSAERAPIVRQLVDTTVTAERRRVKVETLDRHVQQLDSELKERNKSFQELQQQMKADSTLLESARRSLAELRAEADEQLSAAADTIRSQSSVPFTLEKWERRRGAVERGLDRVPDAQRKQMIEAFLEARARRASLDGIEKLLGGQ